MIFEKEKRIIREESWQMSLVFGNQIDLIAFAFFVIFSGAYIQRRRFNKCRIWRETKCQKSVESTF